MPLLVTLLTTTPVEPPYSAPYWCVCTWYSDIESSDTRACVPCEPPRRESLSFCPSTRNRLLVVAWPLALNWPPSNDPDLQRRHQAGDRLHQAELAAVRARQAVDLRCW